jgi:hypothetical protein
MAWDSFDIVAGSAVGTVLDGSFNAMGVESLKVIDTSALPDQPDGSRPMALVYMIAEMAADNIIDTCASRTLPRSCPPPRSILRSIGGQREQYGYQTGGLPLDVGLVWK